MNEMVRIDRKLHVVGRKGLTYCGLHPGAANGTEKVDLLCGRCMDAFHASLKQDQVVPAEIPGDPPTPLTPLSSGSRSIDSVLGGLFG